jgi:hypothetical protein
VMLSALAAQKLPCSTTATKASSCRASSMVSNF